MRRISAQIADRGSCPVSCQRCGADSPSVSARFRLLDERQPVAGKTDDRESWHELNPDLPDVPIIDVIREHDELAMTSHGRGVWALDNTALLRQAQPVITERAVHLFDPAAAYRLGHRVVLWWWLRDEVQSGTDAPLAIVDATGDVVRTFTPATEGEERDRWAGPSAPVKSGLNRLRWDLRTDGGAVPRHDPLGRAHDSAHGAAGDVRRVPDGGRPRRGDRGGMGHHEVRNRSNQASRILPDHGEHRERRKTTTRREGPIGMETTFAGGRRRTIYGYSNSDMVHRPQPLAYF